MELKKTIYHLKDDDAELKPWEERLNELAGEPDDIDEMLAEIEQQAADQAAEEAKGQLELFGGLLSTLADQRGTPLRREEPSHEVLTREGKPFRGSWDEIVLMMRDANTAFVGRSMQEFMATEARRGYSLTGVTIPTRDAESFIRGSADAGLLRIVK